MNAMSTCKIKISTFENFTFKYIKKYISHIISNNLVQISYNLIQSCFLKNRNFLEQIF